VPILERPLQSQTKEQVARLVLAPEICGLSPARGAGAGVERGRRHFCGVCAGVRNVVLVRDAVERGPPGGVVARAADVGHQLHLGLPGRRRPGQPARLCRLRGRAQGRPARARGRLRLCGALHLQGEATGPILLMSRLYVDPSLCPRLQAGSLVDWARRWHE
jgi:hypothetical protein